MRKRTPLFITVLSILLLYSGFIGCGGIGPGPIPPIPPDPDVVACEQKRTTFEAGLPIPEPLAGRYILQLINESNVTLLAGTNAAHRAGEPPKPVLPREGTWVIPPNGVLTIDVPEEWERTIPEGSLGPVLWARTGCRFDIAHNLAQCETGDCGGRYDCSIANATPPGAKSLAEWTFDDINHNAAPDISVVDGVNLNMDIVPVGPHSTTPVGPVDPAFWLSPENLPLTVCGKDLRTGCPTEFQLRREQLTFFLQGSPGATDVVACFSNCGQYKFQGAAMGFCPAGFRCPGEPPLDCIPDPATNPLCYYWKTFCCAVPAGDPQQIYTKDCSSDADCAQPQNAGCWDSRGKCSCTAFNKNPDCHPDICTNSHAEKPSFQPPFGLCSNVTDATGEADACIGDDTFHEVMPRGLTWPNDPETYFSNAKAYRIVFAPGGTTVPISESGPIPLCADLPASYDYPKALTDCSGVPGKVHGGARVSPALWSCDIQDGTATDGVLCKW